MGIKKQLETSVRGGKTETPREERGERLCAFAGQFARTGFSASRALRPALGYAAITSVWNLG